MALVRDLEEIIAADQETDLGALQAFADRLAAKVPASEWAKLPADLSENHDKYASGLLQYPE